MLKKERVMMKIMTVAAAVLQNRNGCVLLTRRPDNKPYPGLYEFPGGKIEVGERPEEALQRELFEELHLFVPIDSMKPLTFVSYTYPQYHVILLLYLIRQWTGEMLMKENQKGYIWTNVGSLDTLPPLLPANEGLLETLQKYL